MKNNAWPNQNQSVLSSSLIKSILSHLSPYRHIYEGVEGNDVWFETIRHKETIALRMISDQASFPLAHSIMQILFVPGNSIHIFHLQENSMTK